MLSTKRTFLTSIISLALCLSMFLGTTFAWFTDTVSSIGNIIASGKLDVSMHWSDKLLDANSDQWQNADGTPVFNYNNWEPGYTEVRYIKIANEGTLNLKWTLSIQADGKVTDLSDVIDVYYFNPAITVTKDTVKNGTSSGSLTDVLANNSGVAGSLTPGQSNIIAIAFHMDELAGNEYQGKSLCEAGFSLKLLATQAVGEFDSFDDQYDVDAEWPYNEIKYSEAEDISDKLDPTTGGLTEDVTIGEPEDTISASVPADVKLADGADKLTLSVNSIETPNKDVPVESGESAKSVDVHIEGLAEDNTTPVTVTLKQLFKPGLNTTSVKMYHVENGTPVAMTLVANPTNHNEFSYDPATGDVVMTVATFSEYEIITDNKNLWEGNFDISWYNTTDKEFTLITADQLAGFGAIVDGGGEYTNKDGTKINVPSDMFEGKTIYLGADIDLAGGHSLNPIGSGYVNGTKNSGGSEGRSFMGTFDGQNHTIRYLYQNGWDIGLSYCNLGGGLFGSVCNATIKNLNMLDAEIVMECVEQGVIAGLAQGNCIFENITISNCSVANYQKATGGVVGEVSWGIGDAEEFTHTFSNIKIDNKTVVGSLWGDFDAPVGGVIGARWDDSDRTKVVMENVEVACRLDVYNDVTSTYQWYAYRRAGMLIGNTEQVAADGRTAAAPFLTCSGVKVCYGDWTDYHYCCFSNYNPSWPWVRVEAGENCTAFSNPRYGVPNGTNDVKVTPENHPKQDYSIHEDGDGCYELIPFGQLYGGGQGVYGGGQTDGYVSTHTGVEIVKYVYTITYINDYQVLYVDYVNAARAAQGVNVGNESANEDVIEWAEKNIGKKDTDFVFNNNWMNAGSTPISKIEAGNDKDITLYPHFNKPYTARFVDQKGNILSWCLFHDGNGGLDDLKSALDSATAHLPDPGKDFEFDYWEVNANGNKVQYSENNFKKYTYDVTIYPVYRYTGNLKLTPVDEGNDGTIDYYMVEAVDKLDETTTIPGNVNGVPVKVVVRLYQNKDGLFGGYFDYASNVNTIIVEEGVEVLEGNSLAYSSGLQTVYLPSTLEKMYKNAFSRNNTIGGLWGETDRKKLTIIYNGTKANWDELVNASEDEWANGLENGSIIQCTDGYYTASGVRLGTGHKWTWTPNPTN